MIEREAWTGLWSEQMYQASGCWFLTSFDLGLGGYFLPCRLVVMQKWLWNLNFHFRKLNSTPKRMPHSGKQLIFGLHSLYQDPLYEIKTKFLPIFLFSLSSRYNFWNFIIGQQAKKHNKWKMQDWLIVGMWAINWRGNFRSVRPKSEIEAEKNAEKRRRVRSLIRKADTPYKLWPVRHLKWSQDLKWSRAKTLIWSQHFSELLIKWSQEVIPA